MIRKDLYDTIDDLYDFCRRKHLRTYKLIDFAKNFIINDDELINFLDKCRNETEDPRGNNIFNKYKWPDLSVETDIDYDIFKKFNRDILTILKYDDLF